jgi:cytochrome c oxidase assembly protein subunit 15
VLGGFTVREHLKPGFVMGHFVLSMLILVAAAALVWSAGREPGARSSADLGVQSRPQMWVVRGLTALGAVTIVAGTAATAAGPHAGGKPGQVIERLSFKGSATLDWTIHRHGDLAAVLGVAAVALWVWLRRTGAGTQVRRAVAAVCLLLAVQGVVGLVQYYTELPTALVWVHVALATATWLALLWAVAAAGRSAAPGARAAESALEAPVPPDRARVSLPA